MLEDNKAMHKVFSRLVLRHLTVSNKTIHTASLILFLFDLETGDLILEDTFRIVLRCYAPQFLPCLLR